MSIDISDRKQFWEVQHVNKTLATLSGCKYDETIDFLQVRPYINEYTNVLEVGVGLGYVTEELNKRCFVSALDISEEALKRVMSYCIALYSVDKIEELPEDCFHVILCHNLVQHIPTALLKIELFYLIRSLKADGVFAVEFISSDTAEDTGNVSVVHGVGNLCRSPKFMRSLVEECGGTAEMVYDVPFKAGIITGVHIFHIRKK